MRSDIALFRRCRALRQRSDLTKKYLENNRLQIQL
jgi:hypothetical protein